MKPEERAAENEVYNSLLYLVTQYRKKPKYVDKWHVGSISHRELGVQVSTGIAIRLPEENFTRMYSASSFLKFSTLRDLADAWLQHKLSEDELKEKIMRITNNILEIYKKKNVKPSTISGGINYADEEIKALLGTQETLLTLHGEKDSDNRFVEEGIYLGAPKNALELILLQLAQEKNKIKLVQLSVCPKTTTKYSV